MSMHGKRLANSSSSPLENASLLSLILSYVGPGQHFFVSTVCKLWHEIYAAVPDSEVASLVVDPHGDADDDDADDDADDAVCKVLCTPQMTLYSAIFASASRVRLAYQHLSVTLERWTWQRIAGRVADAATLQVALELGLAGADMLKGAAYAGSVTKLDLLQAKFLELSKKVILPDDICAYAASSGSIEALQWVEKWGGLRLDTALFQAAKFGHMNLLDHIYHEYDHHLDIDLLSEAAKNGRLSAVEWLFEHDAPYDAATICGGAAESGDHQLVQFVKSKGGEINESTIRDAAWRGHLALCQQLHSEQCPWDENAVAWAGAAGHTELVKWLVEHGCPYDAADVCREAAEHGHLDVIQYMLQLVPLGPGELMHTLDVAGMHYQWQVAAWLRQQLDVLN
jgi:hypothetical protein